LTVSGKALTRQFHSNYYLIKDLTTSRNNFQQDVKIKVLITSIIASLFPNSKVVFR